MEFIHLCTSTFMQFTIYVLIHLCSLSNYVVYWQYLSQYDFGRFIVIKYCNIATDLLDMHQDYDEKNINYVQ